MNDTVSMTAGPRPQDPRDVGAAAQHKLQEWAIDYEYKAEFPVGDVRQVELAQARDSGNIADRESVEEYAEQMRHGAVFPPIVIHGDGLLLDGNTRLAAMKKLRRKTIPAFVAQFPNLELGRTFAAAMNQMGGRRLTPAEANRAAVNLLRFGHTEESVALELGYSRQHISNWRRESEFIQRAQETQVQDREVPKPDQRKLADVKLSAPFAAAVDLVADLKPTAKEVTRLVSEIKDAASESEALSLIAERRSELVPAGPPPHRPSVPKELSGVRRAIPLILNNGSNPLLLIESDPQRREESITRWKQLQALTVDVLTLYSGEGQ